MKQGFCNIFPGGFCENQVTKKSRRQRFAIEKPEALLIMLME